MHSAPRERYCAWNGRLWKVSDSNHYSGAKLSHEALIPVAFFFFFFHLSPLAPPQPFHIHTRSFVLETALRERCFRDFQTPIFFCMHTFSMSFLTGEGM